MDKFINWKESLGFILNYGFKTSKAKSEQKDVSWRKSNSWIFSGPLCKCEVKNRLVQLVLMALLSKLQPIDSTSSPLWVSAWGSNLLGDYLTTHHCSCGDSEPSCPDRTQFETLFRVLIYKFTTEKTLYKSPIFFKGKVPSHQFLPPRPLEIARVCHMVDENAFQMGTRTLLVGPTKNMQVTHFFKGILYILQTQNKNILILNLNMLTHKS